MMKKNLSIKFVCVISICFIFSGFAVKNNFGLSFKSALKGGPAAKTKSENKNDNKHNKNKDTNPPLGNSRNSNPNSGRSGLSNQSNIEKNDSGNPIREDDGTSSQTNLDSTRSQNSRTEASSKTDSNAQNNRNNQNNTGQGGSGNNFWSLLLMLFAGLAGLSIIGGIVFYISRVAKNVKDEQRMTEGGFKSVHTKQNSLREDVDQLKKMAELLNKQIKDQKNEITWLKLQVKKNGDLSDAPVNETAFTPPPPAPEFPVSVENYLAKNADRASVGKHEPLLGTLKEDSSDGAFYLVRGNADENTRYAVPRSKQFVTKDDFSYHYSNYYECASPGGGEVWIRKPATVRRTSDGWKLDAPGELEIR